VIVLEGIGAAGFVRPELDCGVEGLVVAAGGGHADVAVVAQDQRLAVRWREADVVGVHAAAVKGDVFDS